MPLSSLLRPAPTSLDWIGFSPPGALNTWPPLTSTRCPAPVKAGTLLPQLVDDKVPLLMSASLSHVRNVTVPECSLELECFPEEMPFLITGCNFKEWDAWYISKRLIFGVHPQIPAHLLEDSEDACLEEEGGSGSSNTIKHFDDDFMTNFITFLFVFLLRDCLYDYWLSSVLWKYVNLTILLMTNRYASSIGPSGHSASISCRPPLLTDQLHRELKGRLYDGGEGG